MIRLIIIGAALAGIGFLVWQLLPARKWQRCGRCKGQGYWRATRGERVTCDACQGYGSVPRIR